MCLWIMGNTCAVAACEQEHGTGSSPASSPACSQHVAAPGANSWWICTPAMPQLMADTLWGHTESRPTMGTWPQRVQYWLLWKRHLRAPTMHQPHLTSGTGKAFLTLVQLELAQELLAFHTATILQFYRIQQAGHADTQTLTASGRCFS